jgi:hypothetical protein
MTFYFTPFSALTTKRIEHYRSIRALYVYGRYSKLSGYAESISFIGPLVKHHEDHEEDKGQAGKFRYRFFVVFVSFVVVIALLEL